MLNRKIRRRNNLLLDRLVIAVLGGTNPRLSLKAVPRSPEKHNHLSEDEKQDITST